MEQVRDQDVRVYSVWVPIIWSDFERSVPRATARLGDQRVSHYWDGQGELVRGYSPVLGLPREQPAWDVYLLFDRDAQWGNDPPAPLFWMHQLGIDEERQLDGARLAAEVTRLLQQRAGANRKE